MPTINLPANNWRPRDYQIPAWRALEGGCTRLALAWPRRHGKDEIALHWAACSMMTRPGAVWHMLPLANQSRKALWDAVNPRTGKRRIDDAFPPELRETTREQDMFIRFKNGSTWQVVGSDNYNALVGSPPVGVVFSEYAMADPNAWAFLRPILVENGGWAIFISTPRGRNHFSRLIDYAKDDPNWFGQVLTVEDTGAIPIEAIQRERKELRNERGDKEAEAIIRQEYYCDFDADIPGAYFGELMKSAEVQGRVGSFPHVIGQPVGTAWDIGVGDSTVIWFYQLIGHKVRIINVLEGSGVGLEWYAKKLLAMDYVYSDTIWPHDGAVQEWGSGQSRVQVAAGYGLKPRVLERDSVDDGIQAVRMMLPACEFNTTPDTFPGETPDDAKARMTRAMDAIRQYRREYDDKLQRFRDKPLHDWTSHFADALRYLAKGRQPFRGTQARPINAPRQAVADYAVLG
jgi:phage terminase large subunit